MERQTDAAGTSAPARTTVGLLTHVLVPLNRSVLIYQRGFESNLQGNFEEEIVSVLESWSHLPKPLTCTLHPPPLPLCGLFLPSRLPPADLMP